MQGIWARLARGSVRGRRSSRCWHTSVSSAAAQAICTSAREGHGRPGGAGGTSGALLQLENLLHVGAAAHKALDTSAQLHKALDIDESSATSLARGLLRGGRAARRAAWRPAAWRAAWRAMCFLHIGPKTKKKKKKVYIILYKQARSAGMGQPVQPGAGLD